MLESQHRLAAGLHCGLLRRLVYGSGDTRVLYLELLSLYNIRKQGVAHPTSPGASVLSGPVYVAWLS